MINFCSPLLNPHITASTVSSDGYEVTNLISDDPLKRQKGFLAYRAIKPPVTITLNFMCNVNICHLILWSHVGSQKSMSFEILASSSLKVNENDTEQYKRVSFGNVERNDIGIIFYRRIYNSDYLKSTQHLNGFTRKALPGNAYPLLNNVASLQIKIIRTSSSVPALARVELWGHPGKSCDNKLRQNVNRLWKSVPKKSLPMSCSDQPEKQETTVCLKESDFIIPEEFLDSLTCSLMALPMILPCGKVVDQSTLDKHKECEANWGRGPSDPFTGKLFTEKCKPVLATALKARIDKFLFDHSENQELWTVPRTIGKRKQSTINSSANAYSEVSASTSYEQKDSVDKILLASCSYNLQKRHDIREDMVKRKKLMLMQDETHRISKGSDSASEDEDDLSLNHALQSTLAGLPRYTNFNNSSNEYKEVCSVCKIDKMLFKLPCSHIICRNCLVIKRQSNQLICDVCKNNFGTSDPVRYHI